MMVLVCGGRTRTDYEALSKFLDGYLPGGEIVIIQGGQKGVDAMAKRWARSKGHCCIEVEANWDFYGTRAGPIRNAWMARLLKPDLVIAFPGGSGTANMVKQARKYGIQVQEVS